MTRQNAVVLAVSVVAVVTMLVLFLFWLNDWSGLNNPHLDNRPSVPPWSSRPSHS